MEDRWAKLEEIVRRVVREELSTTRAEKLKVRLEGGKWIGITEEQMQAWRTGYPAVDLDIQLREAAAWCLSNPTDAPRSKYPAFINTWLKRHQDRHAIRSIPTERKTETKFKHCEYCQKVATGNVGGIWCCDDHTRDAMDRKPRAHMWGVQAKPVAGME